MCQFGLSYGGLKATNLTCRSIFVQKCQRTSVIGTRYNEHSGNDCVTLYSSPLPSPYLNHQPPFPHWFNLKLLMGSFAHRGSLLSRNIMNNWLGWWTNLLCTWWLHLAWHVEPSAKLFRQLTPILSLLLSNTNFTGSLTYIIQTNLDPKCLKYLLQIFRKPLIVHQPLNVLLHYYSHITMSHINTYFTMSFHHYYALPLIRWHNNHCVTNFNDEMNTINYTYHIRRNKRPCPNKRPSLYFSADRADFAEHVSF